jgi:hypothetical protein
MSATDASGSAMAPPGVAAAAVAVEMEPSGAASSPFMVVYVTVPDQVVADKLAGSLVGDQLAACVNIVPGR